VKIFEYETIIVQDEAREVYRMADCPEL